MWILDWLPGWIFTLITLAGAGAYLVTEVLGNIPFVSQYLRAIRAGAIVALAFGLYMMGGSANQEKWEARVKELEAQGVCPMDAPLLAIIQLQGETNVTTTRTDNESENSSSHTTRQGVPDRSGDCVTSVRRIRKVIQAGLPTEKLP